MAKSQVARGASEGAGRAIDGRSILPLKCALAGAAPSGGRAAEKFRRHLQAREPSVGDPGAQGKPNNSITRDNPAYRAWEKGH